MLKIKHGQLWLKNTFIGLGSRCKQAYLYLKHDKDVADGCIVERDDAVGLRHDFGDHPDDVGQDGLPIDGQEVQVSRGGGLLPEVGPSPRLGGVRCVGYRGKGVFDDLNLIFGGIGGH